MLTRIRDKLSDTWPFMLRRTHRAEIARWSEYEDAVAAGHARQVDILSNRVHTLEALNAKLEAEVTVRGRMIDEVKRTWRPPVDGSRRIRPKVNAGA